MRRVGPGVARAELKTRNGATQLNGIVSDLLLAAGGDTDVKERLLQGTTIAGKTYTHLWQERDRVSSPGTTLRIRCHFGKRNVIATLKPHPSGTFSGAVAQ